MSLLLPFLVGGQCQLPLKISLTCVRQGQSLLSPSTARLAPSVTKGEVFATRVTVEGSHPNSDTGVHCRIGSSVGLLSDLCMEYAFTTQQKIQSWL